MKKLLIPLFLFSVALLISAAPPILRQFGTTNTPIVLTNIIQSLATGGNASWNITNMTVAAESLGLAQPYNKGGGQVSNMLYGTFYNQQQEEIAQFPEDFGMIHTNNSLGTTFLAMTNGLWNFAVILNLNSNDTAKVTCFLATDATYDGGLRYNATSVNFSDSRDMFRELCVSDTIPMEAGNAVSVQVRSLDHSYASFATNAVSYSTVRITRIQ